MLRWLSNIFSGSLGTATDANSRFIRLDELLRAPGKARQEALISLAQSSSRDEFTDILHCPSLAGSAIKNGNLANSERSSRDVLSTSTSLFSPAQVNAFLEGASIAQSIFLLRKEPSKIGPQPQHKFTIGRSKEQDIRIVDLSISRSHAMITLGTKGASIEDCSSRNGTKVNGRRIGTVPEPLHDRDIVSLGRYDFTFYAPETLYECLKQMKSTT